MRGDDVARVANSRAERWRVFCAVELPTEVRLRALDHITRLRAQVPDAPAGWPRAENLHLTLKFLGEIEVTRIEALSRAAARAAQETEGFKIIIEGAGAFPAHGAPRVLWLGVTDPSGGLARLQRHLEDECEREGFKPEERPFHPHLTIARLRGPQHARALARHHQEAGFAAFEFPVTNLVALRSEPGPGGSRYTKIVEHAFIES